MEQRSDERWLILDLAVKEFTIAKVFKELRSNKLEPIILKGWAAARFYTDPSKRHPGDIDIAVEPSDFTTAQSILRNFEIPRENIDLHCGFRDRELSSWVDVFSRTYLVDVNGVGVRVLGDEDHLRLIAAHWLIDGGFNKVRLWDVYFMVQNRKPDFDWDLCLDSPNPNRRSWVLAAVATARDFLGLDVSGLPTEVQEFKLPRWYVLALEKEWERGPYLRISLTRCLTRPKLFFEQARRRFPPNPIAATTDTEGPIDDSPRWPYQVKSILKKVRNASPIGGKG